MVVSLISPSNFVPSHTTCDSSRRSIIRLRWAVVPSMPLTYGDPAGGEIYPSRGGLRARVVDGLLVYHYAVQCYRQCRQDDCFIPW
ncbi:hypothetical protein KCP75_05055 [Salmonella enterica subsp. enterica]|nr:hypothetical protein KCP75_05055 [Salmonella enterica subsp. enterica]